MRRQRDAIGPSDIIAEIESPNETCFIMRPDFRDPGYHLAIGGDVNEADKHVANDDIFPWCRRPVGVDGVNPSRNTAPEYSAF